MNIQTVKIQKEGYLVNGTMSVPSAEGNRHYQAVQEWIAEGNTPEPEFTQEQLDAQAYNSAKEQKLLDVGNITVTTQAGNTFDGDEISQSRMARAIASSDPLETTQWKLADNSIITVTREELKEALRLAGEAQTLIWMA